MKYILPVLVLAMFVNDANAARSPRPAMMSNKVMTSQRVTTASVNQLNALVTPGNTNTNTAQQANTKTEEEKVVDKREAERNACINNNIGIGNTFVWASRYSNTSNYASMVEDVEHPENNVCFVRVELTSDNDSRVNVSDVPAKYFAWGENIECGSWVDEKEMEKRILDARKGARIGGIVASSVGGAGIGVGAMELFGNKLIDKASKGKANLEGQESEFVSKSELYFSQLMVLQTSDPTKYTEIIAAAKTILANKNNEDAKNLYDGDNGEYGKFIEMAAALNK